MTQSCSLQSRKCPCLDTYHYDARCVIGEFFIRKLSELPLIYTYCNTNPLPTLPRHGDQATTVNFLGVVLRGFEQDFMAYKAIDVPIMSMQGATEIWKTKFCTYSSKIGCVLAPPRSGTRYAPKHLDLLLIIQLLIQVPVSV